MDVLIRRTRGEDGRAPIPGARKRRFTRVDRRTVDDPGRVPAYRGSRRWWFGRGARHRVEGGCICREFPAEGWFYRVDSPEDLLGLCRRFGEVTIRVSPLNEAIYEIQVDEAGPAPDPRQTAWPDGVCLPACERGSCGSAAPEGVA